MRLIDFILHIDVHLQNLIASRGKRVYILLFMIVLVETGLVIMPFLPGDSLLFAAWSFAAIWSLNIWTLLVSITVAAILWDTINYAVGKKIWTNITKLYIGKCQLVKPEHLHKTEAFFAKHGKKSIILARFMPIIRTCAPFVAGMGNMEYKSFISYNIIWWALWVFSLTLLGYFFGQQDIVKHNFEKVILLIILISILPLITEVLRWWYKNHASKNHS